MSGFTRPTGLRTMSDIPVSWAMRRNGSLFNERRDKNHPDLEMYSVTQQRGVVPQASLDSKVTAPSEDRTGYNRIVPGDLVYNKMRMWQGAVGVAPGEGIVSTAYVVMEPKPGVNSRFYEYLYRTPAFICESGRYSYGLCDDMNSLRSEHFKSMMSPRPPTTTQNAVVSFLDFETTRIDALIDRKQHLVSLLLEKRTALIADAVSKGLGPEAPTTSGRQSPSAVPTHWSIVPLKRVIKRIEQGWSPQCENRPAQPDEWGVIKAGVVNNGIFRERESKALPTGIEPLPEYELRPGDFLVSRANTRELLGSAGVVPVGTRPKLLLCDKIFRVRLDLAAIEPRFLAYAFLSPTIRYQLEIDATGASNSMQNVGQDTLRALRLPLPALAEQVQIADRLDTACRVLDDLVSRTRESIDLLSEYRTALISAAVTGQIDIPGTETSEDVA